MEPSRWGFDWEAMSERCVQALVLAQQEAQFLKASQVGTEHVLIGLLSGRSVGTELLGGHGVDVHLARATLEKFRSRDDGPSIRQFSWRVRRAVEIAFEEAGHARSPFMNTDHLYVGLFSQDDATARAMVIDLGVPVDDLLGRLRAREGASGETGLLFTADLLAQLPVAGGEVPELEQVTSPPQEMSLDRFLEVLDELSRALQTAQRLVLAARPRRPRLDVPEVVESEWPVVDDDVYPISGLVAQVLSEVAGRRADRVDLVPHEGALRIEFHEADAADTVDLPAILRSVVPATVMRMAGLNPLEKGREMEGRLVFRQGERGDELWVRSEPVRRGLRVVITRSSEDPA